MIIFKDICELVKVIVGMVNVMMKGEELEVNDIEIYNNGVKVVLFYLLELVVVIEKNLNEVLVGLGYYIED